MHVIRNFINSRGTRYTRSRMSVGAMFKDRWVHMVKGPDGIWLVAFHTVATGESVQFIMGDVSKNPIPPVVAWHIACKFYREHALGEKAEGITRTVVSEAPPTVH